MTDRQLSLAGARGSAPALTAISLQSGSSGNALYVESATTALLVDAGISASSVVRRLAEFGRDPSRIQAILVSHDHGDHVRHAGVLHRRLGAPVLITEGSLRMARKRFPLGEMIAVECFRPGASLRIGDIGVETISTPHDGTQGVAFVMASGDRRLGVLTDLGHAFEGLGAVLKGLDGVFLESNYDPAMLRNGGYPAPLKRRIAGPAGHLSNDESAELLGEYASDRLRWACLAHLSAENNSPEIALETHRRVHGTAITLHVARRDGSSGPLAV